MYTTCFSEPFIMGKKLLFIIFVMSSYFPASYTQQYFRAAGVVSYTIDIESDNNTIVLSPVFFDTIPYSNSGIESTDPVFKDHLSDEYTVSPSKHWKPVSGDKVPPGVDVKINLKTGEKVIQIAADAVNGSSVSRKPKKFIYTEDFTEANFNDLKTALKTLKKNERVEKTKPHYKESRKVECSSDMLKRMLKQYVNSNISGKMAILEELEYLVHQYSAAIDFVKIGGVHILLPDLLSSNNEVKAAIALVLGSAMQGNPPVQQAVFQTEAILQLLLAVHSSNSTEVKSRSLYALANLIRHYPEAQLKFVRLGGFFMLSEIFQPLLPQKLKLKVIDLLHDLALERAKKQKSVDSKTDERNEINEDDEISDEKHYQHFRISVGNVVQENGYCSSIPRLIFAAEYDTQERAIKAMNVFADDCKSEFSSVLDRLRLLAEEYRNAMIKEFNEYMKEHNSLDGIESSDLYFSGLYNSVTELIQALEASSSVSFT